MAPSIFFASRMPGLMDLRKWVNDYGAGRVWVSEHSKNADTLREQIKTEPDSVRIACLQQVQASRYMICVFNGEYGSVITTDKARSLGLEVSLLELELITAVLTGVPTVVLLLGELPTDARTQDLWAILEQQKTVRIDPKIYSLATIKDAIKPLIDKMTGWTTKISALMTPMSQRRLTRLESPLTRPDIRFLANVDGFTRRPEPELIVELTERALSESNGYDKLALLWMALRHCMPINPSAPKEVMIASSRALSAWVSTASWAGLHGHGYVGVLAGLNSIKTISETLGRFGNEGRESVLSAVNGGLASQYYSASKLIDNDTDKSVLLERAKKAVEAAEENNESMDRVLPIKAAVEVALGHKTAALKTYREVLTLRQSSPNPSLAAIGEAESDLGWGYFLTGQGGKALEMLESGIGKLRESGNIEFTVRQLRKLCRVAAFHNPIRAWDAIVEGHDIACKHGLTDQIRQMESLPVVGKLLRRRRENRKP